MWHGFGDAHVNHLADQAGGLLAAAEIDGAVAFGAAHEFLRILARGAFHQDALHDAHAAGADGALALLQRGLHALQAAQLDFVRGVVLQIGGGRAGAGAEDEAEGVIVAHVVDELHHLVEIGVGSFVSHGGLVFATMMLRSDSKGKIGRAHV